MHNYFTYTSRPSSGETMECKDGRTDGRTEPVDVCAVMYTPNNTSRAMDRQPPATLYV